MTRTKKPSTEAAVRETRRRSDVLEGDGSKQVDHHLELAAPLPRAFGFFA
jgi:hypothetical protein